MTTDTTNSQAASFRAELLPILRNMYLHFEPDAIDDEICSVLDMIDAKLAQAREEGRRDSHEANVTMLNLKLKAEDRAATAEAKLAAWDKIVEASLANDYATRAIAAESRLAEIQRGVKGLTRWLSTFDGLCQAERIDPPSDDIFVRMTSVLALLQPHGQADTSGLPGRKEK